MKDTKEKILTSFGVNSEQDLLSMHDKDLVRRYSLLFHATASYAIKYYEECNEIEKAEFANAIRDCIMNGKTMFVSAINREGVKSEENHDYFEKLKREKHDYQYIIE